MEITEKKIIDAAITVFNDDLSAPLETVALKAGVTRRTLHRYFKDRTQLFETCKNEMMDTCREAMTAAYYSSTDPLVQLEHMLYAGIDCGTKYAFLNKLYQRTDYRQMPETDEAGTYENIKVKWFKLIGLLQQQGLISKQLTLSWIFMLFGGMITTTIAALNAAHSPADEVKQFAWYSFSRSIGVK